MNPKALLRRIEGLADAAGGADRAIRRGSRSAVKGVRARGHRVSMDGLRIRVTGPVAPGVAAHLSGLAGRGADDALRELLESSK